MDASYTQTIFPLPENKAQIFIIYFSKFSTTNVVLFREFCITVFHYLQDYIYSCHSDIVPTTK